MLIFALNMDSLSRPAVKLKGEPVSLRLEIDCFPGSTWSSMNAESSRKLGHLYVTELEKFFCCWLKKVNFTSHGINFWEVPSLQTNGPELLLCQECCAWCVGLYSGPFQLSKGGLKASKTAHMENSNPLSTYSSKKLFVSLVIWKEIKLLLFLIIFLKPHGSFM